MQVDLRVSLVRRFFTEDLEFINTAKNYIEVSDFYELVPPHHLPPGEPREARRQELRAVPGRADRPEVARVRRRARTTSRCPRRGTSTSDGVLNFVEYNHLEDVYNRKYLEIDQIRREYPHIVQVFKNSHFSPEIVKGLSVALDDFEDRPLIVRSSSLLEDRIGSAFSGKYKSLFLANQGTKSERLSALMDAIAEVYASIFGPDPIEYRAERGLLDVHEEMGIMIQEVVGTRVGQYFLPAFAGVAFSNNEFRWSARIKREDGLVRLVPGLGTRAVDRVGDDYPVLVAPGQPGLRVNVTPDEVVRYSPRKIDVINLETRRFETVDLDGPPRGVRPGVPGRAADRLARGRQRDPPPRPDRLGLRRGPPRRHLRRADRAHALRPPDARAAPAAAREDRHAGRHRVRLRRQGLLPAAVPAAELLGGRRAVADPAGPAGRHA